MARWRSLLEALPPDSPMRMPNGQYRVACKIDGVALDLVRLRDAMQRAAQHLTGWPPWWWPTPQEIAPYIHENTIECHFASQIGGTDAGHADFWRASTSSERFLIRGYIEDALTTDRQPVQPGGSLPLKAQVWYSQYLGSG